MGAACLDFSFLYPTPRRLLRLLCMFTKADTDTTMDHPGTCHLEGMCCDLVTNIMSRVDGSALASLACTSSKLRDIARHHSLWKQLCQSTWPSTEQHLISTSLICHFDKFFADSYPFIFYDEAAKHSSPKPETSTSPTDFVSLVDIYHKNQCVFSSVRHGIPEADDFFTQEFMDDNCYMISSERTQWFMNCPFNLQLLDLTYDEDDYGDHDNDDHDLAYLGHNNNNERSTHMYNRADHSKKLMEDLRLSWILLDKKTGKAVNLSTWKPLSAQMIPPHGDYVMHFGSIIPVEENVLPQKLARCKITTKFKVTQMHGHLRFQWTQISMSIENITGSFLDGKTSLMILNKALYSMRTANWLKVENGFKQYEKRKREMIRRIELRETLTNWISMSTEIVVFTLLYHAFHQLF